MTSDVWVRDVLGDRLVESATALIGTSDGQDRWDLVDALGSLIAQGPAAQGAGVTQAMGWSAFGVAQPGTTGWDEAGGFTGQDTDLTSGLVGFYARFLDPMTGGWASPDAWAGLLALPGTLNSHAYVTGDPIGSVDVLGYFGWGDIVNTAKKMAGDVRDAAGRLADDVSGLLGGGSSSGSSGKTSYGPASPQIYARSSTR